MYTCNLQATLSDCTFSIFAVYHTSDGSLFHTQPEQALCCRDNGFAAHGSLMSFGKVKFTLEHAMQAQTGSKGFSSTSSVTFGARCGWVVNATPRLLYSREKDAAPMVQQAGCSVRTEHFISSPQTC